jgi:hypothetical protein
LLRYRGVAYSYCTDNVNRIQPLPIIISCFVFGDDIVFDVLFISLSIIKSKLIKLFKFFQCKSPKNPPENNVTGEHFSNEPEETENTDVQTTDELQNKTWAETELEQMESKVSKEDETSEEMLTTDQVEDEELKEEEQTDQNDAEDNGIGYTEANIIQQRKSYPVILEAKPQHSGLTIHNTEEEGKFKEEDASNISNVDDGEMTVNGVMLPSDSPNGGTTIVQYAVTPKIEGEEIQVGHLTIQYNWQKT